MSRMRNAMERVGGNVLPAETAPRAERERLARFLDVGAGGVEPALGFEGHGGVEVLGGVGDGPGAGIDFGLGLDRTC